MCSQGSWVVAVTTKPQGPHEKKVPADNSAGFWWPLARGCIWYLSALEGGICAFSQPVPLWPSGWCELWSLVACWRPQLPAVALLQLHVGVFVVSRGASWCCWWALVMAGLC